MTRLGFPVSVIVPAYDEELAIGGEVRAIHDVLSALEIPYEIIVVDDGSRDQTAKEAACAGARLLRHPENRGYGAAIKTGLLAAQYNTIVITDADGTYPPDQIPELVSKLDTADMVVGARIGENVQIPRARRPAKWLLGRLATYIVGRPIPDLNSGLRAFRRDCVTQYLPILSNRFSFTTTVTVALLADDYFVAYHPINYHQRVGKSKLRPRHFTDFLILILRLSMMFEPLKVFVPLAAGFISLGLLKVAYDLAALFVRAPSVSWSLLLQPTLSTSAVLLLFVGLQFLMIGMMADGVVRRIAQHNRPLVLSRRVATFEAEAPGSHQDAER
jgi:glycosyltransferase involved in cell wall biosynthesis